MRKLRSMRDHACNILENFSKKERDSFKKIIVQKVSVIKSGEQKSRQES